MAAARINKSTLHTLLCESLLEVIIEALEAHTRRSPGAGKTQTSIPSLLKAKAQSWSGLNSSAGTFDAGMDEFISDASKTATNTTIAPPAPPIHPPVIPRRKVNRHVAPFMRDRQAGDRTPSQRSISIPTIGAGTTAVNECIYSTTHESGSGWQRGEWRCGGRGRNTETA
ncbi:hypothetical protein HKX48_000895 [Thoreauomyces humboldtii]|nr:hypothetical protein HKX48_000895 [Thoreauomyces humboldtii]